MPDEHSARHGDFQQLLRVLQTLGQQLKREFVVDLVNFKKAGAVRAFFIAAKHFIISVILLLSLRPSGSPQHHHRCCWGMRLGRLLLFHYYCWLGWGRCCHQRGLRINEFGYYCCCSYCFCSGLIIVFAVAYIIIVAGRGVHVLAMVAAADYVQTDVAQDGTGQRVVAVDELVQDFAVFEDQVQRIFGGVTA